MSNDNSRIGLSVDVIVYYNTFEIEIITDDAFYYTFIETAATVTNFVVIIIQQHSYYFNDGNSVRVDRHSHYSTRD